MTNTKRLWQGAIFLLSFSALGLLGREAYVQPPGVPVAVVTERSCRCAWMPVARDVLFNIGAFILALFMARFQLGARSRRIGARSNALQPAE